MYIVMGISGKFSFLPENFLSFRKILIFHFPEKSI